MHILYSENIKYFERPDIAEQSRIRKSGWSTALSAITRSLHITKPLTSNVIPGSPFCDLRTSVSPLSATLSPKYIDR